jgi:phosphate uptake regulator
MSLIYGYFVVLSAVIHKRQREKMMKGFRFMGFGYRNMTQDAAQAFRVE